MRFQQLDKFLLETDIFMVAKAYATTKGYPISETKEKALAIINQKREDLNKKIDTKSKANSRKQELLQDDLEIRQETDDMLKGFFTIFHESKDLFKLSIEEKEQTGVKILIASLTENGEKIKKSLNQFKQDRYADKKAKYNEKLKLVDEILCFLRNVTSQGLGEDGGGNSINEDFNKIMQVIKGLENSGERLLHKVSTGAQEVQFLYSSEYLKRNPNLVDDHAIYLARAVDLAESLLQQQEKEIKQEAKEKVPMCQEKEKSAEVGPLKQREAAEPIENFATYDENYLAIKLALQEVEAIQKKEPSKGRSY